MQCFSCFVLSSVVNSPLFLFCLQLLMNRKIQQTILINFNKLYFTRKLSISVSMRLIVILFASTDIVAIASFHDSSLALMFDCCSQVGPIHNNLGIWYISPGNRSLYTDFVDFVC